MFEFSWWTRWTNTNEKKEEIHERRQKIVQWTKKSTTRAASVNKKKTLPWHFAVDLLVRHVHFILSAILCFVRSFVSPLKRCIIAWINTYDCTHRNLNRCERRLPTNPINQPSDQLSQSFRSTTLRNALARLLISIAQQPMQYTNLTCSRFFIYRHMRSVLYVRTLHF